MNSQMWSFHIYISKISNGKQPYMKKIAKEDIQKTYRCFINKYDYDFINNVQSILDYLNWNSSKKFTKKVKPKTYPDHCHTSKTTLVYNLKRGKLFRSSKSHNLHNQHRVLLCSIFPILRNLYHPTTSN